MGWEQLYSMGTKYAENLPVKDLIQNHKDALYNKPHSKLVSAGAAIICRLFDSF